MAFSSVNDQITYSVTATGVQVLGAAPAVAMGNLYLATSQALAEAALNASQAQQANNQIVQAVTVKSVEWIHSLPVKRKS